MLLSHSLCVVLKCHFWMSRTRDFFLKLLVCVNLINESHMGWHEDGKDRVSFFPFPCFFVFPVLRCAAFFVVVALDIRVGLGPLHFISFSPFNQISECLSEKKYFYFLILE